MTSSALATQLSDEEKIAEIALHFGKIMETLGLDLRDPSLVETPKRVAEMYVKEIFSGLDSKNFPEMSYFESPFPQNQDNLLLVKDITVNSFCEHHFVPFIGTATVAYLPNKKILGLSKINRLVDYFCKRPQLQERLTTQIANSLSLILETENIAVILHAKHACVSMRGIQDASSSVSTSSFLGKFQSDTSLRAELFAKIS